MTTPKHQTLSDYQILNIRVTTVAGRETVWADFYDPNGNVLHDSLDGLKEKILRTARELARNPDNDFRVGDRVIVPGVDEDDDSYDEGIVKDINGDSVQVYWTFCKETYWDDYKTLQLLIN